MKISPPKTFTSMNSMSTPLRETLCGEIDPEDSENDKENLASRFTSQNLDFCPMSIPQHLGPHFDMFGHH